MTSVLYEKRERIAWVTLNRPGAMNALDDALNDELWRVWADFAEDPQVDVAILSGAGKAFCAGADLKTFIPKWDGADLAAPRRNAPRGLGGGLTRGQHRISKPVIGAVNGVAVGGGFELALACDIRIASTAAKFGVFEVRHGLHPADGGLVRLCAIAGTGVALDLALTGREIDAAEAHRLRLVSTVVEPDALLATAEAWAKRIVGNSQQAIRSAKETVLDLIGRPLDDALRLETLNGYSCVGDFSDVRQRLQKFHTASREAPKDSKK